MTLLDFILCMVGYGCSLVMLGRFFPHAPGLVRLNWQGRKVATAGGVVVPLALTLSAPLMIAGQRWDGMSQGCLLIAYGYSLWGLLDDCAGFPARGLGGHLRQVLRGRVSSGVLKAAGGLLVAWAALVTAGRPWPWYAPGAVALTANAFNQVDKRPGWAATMATLAVVAAGPLGAPSYVLLGTLAAYLPADLGCRVMLGDAGANCLGALVGLLVSYRLDPGALVTYILIVGVFNAVADCVSLSLLVERAKGAWRGFRG